jgi:5-methylcytosine-specific restriction endonuclease McrA
MRQEVRELSKDWSRIREEALKRDNYTCQGRECRGVYKRVGTHHIIPRRKGGPNTLDNLVTSCPSCHRKEEPRDRQPIGKVKTFKITDELHEELMRLRKKSERFMDVIQRLVDHYKKGHSKR